MPPKPEPPSADLIARATSVLAHTPTIDFHTHLGLWETRGLNSSDPMAAYIGDDAVETHVRAMIKAGCKAGSINMTSDLPMIKLGAPGNKRRNFEPGEAWAEYQRLWANLNELLAVLPIEIATRPQDIPRLHKAGKLAAFLSTEGAHMVEDDLDKIGQLKEDGITKLQPLHYVYSRLGDIQTDADVHGGLSPLGKDAVRLATSAGMMIDAAHASEKATIDMIEAAGGPIVLSHTLMRHQEPATPQDAARYARWIAPDHARLIAQTGGLIGTWAVGAPYGAGSAEQFVGSVMAMIDTVGIRHVCWSTDHIQMGMGPWFPDYQNLTKLCAMLLSAGLSDQELGLFMGGNVMRLMDTGKSNRV